MANGDPSFGERMAAFRREGGIRPAGRPPLRAKYRRAIDQVERTFADAMPALARDWVDELRDRDPEQCPEHRRVLCCPECGQQSQRTRLDYRGATYVFDRLMGRPTTRSEGTLQVQFTERLTATMIAVFAEVNEIGEPTARQHAFAERLLAVGALYDREQP